MWQKRSSKNETANLSLYFTIILKEHLSHVLGVRSFDTTFKLTLNYNETLSDLYLSALKKILTLFIEPTPLQPNLQ
jgi:hypothetical protein